MQSIIDLVESASRMVEKEAMRMVGKMIAMSPVPSLYNGFGVAMMA